MTEPKIKLGDLCACLYYEIKTENGQPFPRKNRNRFRYKNKFRQPLTKKCLPCGQAFWEECAVAIIIFQNLNICTLYAAKR